MNNSTDTLSQIGAPNISFGLPGTSSKGYETADDLAQWNRAPALCSIKCVPHAPLIFIKSQFSSSSTTKSPEGKVRCSFLYIVTDYADHSKPGQRLRKFESTKKHEIHFQNRQLLQYRQVHQLQQVDRGGECMLQLWSTGLPYFEVTWSTVALGSS